MKTFADVKRRMVVGQRLFTVQNTYVTKLTGTTRTVTRVQGNGYWYRVDGDSRDGFTPYPKAAAFTFIDANTFRMSLGTGRGDDFVELRFLEPSATPAV